MNHREASIADSATCAQCKKVTDQAWDDGWLCNIHGFAICSEKCFDDHEEAA